MTDYEKLGAFYLGRIWDLEAGQARDEPLLYDARDLTTHAVCVGMTGSGKTGLCIALLEEAAIDGIPALAIDPKGDLGNLLLGFPELRPEDFRPWIDPAEAARQGRTPDEQAQATAEAWRRGLSEWGQDGSRIARLQQSADLAIYTPGSSAGLPLALLRSFAPPPPELVADADALRDRVLAAVSGLLTLVGVDADPLRSREHILLSALLDRAWREGRELDLAGLIPAIQAPPFERLGVLELESFFPAAERFALATRLNNLLASPSFAAWSQGEPLDVGRLLYAPDGRPRLSILSIAQLSEAERMFTVTLVLNEVLAWMRAQPGTSSLRALLYMDEVFGYLPPTANPPSKTPLLTLLKQARAYGLGVVLATQNPVDLDYKGLSNAGTWFLGRLQTERDKARVLEGLEGAAAGARFDRARSERILAGLGSRVFLMHNVHEDEPVVFQSRFALSYLRGPLSREQIAALMAGRRQAPAAASARLPEPEAPLAASTRPVVPPQIEERFLRARAAGGGSLVYRPALLGAGSLHYARAALDLDVWQNAVLLAPLGDAAATRDPWAEALALPGLPDALGDEPERGIGFAALPAAAARPESYQRWAKQLKSHFQRERPLRLLRCRDPQAVSRPGQSEGEFRAWLRQLRHERRDLALEKLRQRYAPALARLRDRIRSAEQRVERESTQYQQQKLQAAVSVGATLLGALFGRKAASVGTLGRATTAARGMGRAARERGEVARAEQSVESLQQQLAALEAEFAAELAAVRDAGEVGEAECEVLSIPPAKADLGVERVALLWTPWRVEAGGHAEPAY